jgi:hypothetical protein
MNAKAGLGLVALLAVSLAAAPPRPGSVVIEEAAPAPYVPSQGAPIELPLAWTTTPSMSTARWWHSATALTDGRVLVVGGDTGASATTAEIYDPTTDTWKLTSPPTLSHGNHVAALLCDGQVLVAGDWDGNSDAQKAEVYDPVTDTWTPVGGMAFSHTYGTATLLDDCKVLVAGGYKALAGAEVYDPTKRDWTPTLNSMSTSRFFHAATALPGGKALVTGGGVDNLGVWYTYTNVDVYDDATRMWTPVAPMTIERRGHTSTLMPDGEVLVTGGTSGGTDNGTDGGLQIYVNELYDAATDKWTVAPRLETARSSHTATLLSTGVLLIVGGMDNTGSAVSSVEGLLGGAFQTLAPTSEDRFLHAAALLAGGRDAVLVAGGVHQATAEVWRPDLPGTACTTGASCASAVCADAVCCATACSGGCRACDVPGAVGTCMAACVDDTHVLGCPGGGDTCAASTCAAQSCAPYLCAVAAGGCGSTCTSVADCAPGFACDVSHQCVPPPPTGDDTGACSVAPPPVGEAGPWVGAALAVVALGLRRRRSGSAAAGGAPP